MNKKVWFGFYTFAAILIVGGSYATFIMLRGNTSPNSTSNAANGNSITAANSLNPRGNNANANVVGTSPTNVTVNISTANPNMSGYLYTSANRAMFFQIVNDQGQLSGTVSEAYRGQGNTFQSFNSPISGTLTGSSISIKVETTGQVDAGQLVGGTLELSIPQQNGATQAMSFIQDTIADYETDVAQVQKTVAAERATAVQAQQQEVLSKENAAIGQFNLVASDEKGIQADVQRTLADLKKQTDDLSKTYQALQVVLGDSTGNQQTADIKTVQADATTVNFDSNTIQSDQFSFANDLASLQQDTAQLSPDLQAAQSLMKQAEIAPLTNFPTETSVSKLTAGVGSLEQSAKQQITSSVNQSQQMVQQANAYANQAAQGPSTSTTNVTTTINSTGTTNLTGLTNSVNSTGGP